MMASDFSETQVQVSEVASQMCCVHVEMCGLGCYSDGEHAKHP